MADADNLDNMLTVAELAREYKVSARTAQRWATELLNAPKATAEQIIALLQFKRIEGIPPTGILLIPRSALPRLAALKKPVGYPKGKPRQQGD